MIVRQTTLYMSNLILAKTELADGGSGISGGENRYRMSFAAFTLWTASAVPDDAFEQGAAEHVPDRRETRDEVIEQADSRVMFH